MNLLLDLIRHIANLPLSSPLSIQVVDEFRRFFYRNILYCMCHGKNMLHFAATNFIRFRFLITLARKHHWFFFIWARAPAGTGRRSRAPCPPPRRRCPPAVNIVLRCFLLKQYLRICVTCPWFNWLLICSRLPLESRAGSWNDWNTRSSLEEKINIQQRLYLAAAIVPLLSEEKFDEVSWQS